MKLFFFLSVLIFSASGQSSLDNQSWSLKTGKKHPNFNVGKNVKSIEADVFSEILSFQERWKLVSEVADMKSPEQAETFLMRCLESNKWFLQSAALKKMKDKNPKLALYYAEKLLINAKALVVRSEAVDILNSIGGPKHTKALWEALGQSKNFVGMKSLWIRPQIVKTIYKLESSKHSKKEWDMLLRDPDLEIKKIARKITRSF